jgi:RimJ/RimL family protein N-acetyltransferase
MLVFETERLALRQMTADDVDRLLGIFQDPVAMRYYPSTKDRPEAEARIARHRRGYEEHGSGMWVAEFRDGGQFAGQCGLTALEVDGRWEVEIGYLFLRHYWGQGLATEAARACRDYGLGPLGRSRLIAIMTPQNTASRRVAEKTGLHLEKEIEWRGLPACVYAIEQLVS